MSIRLWSCLLSLIGGSICFAQPDDPGQPGAYMAGWRRVTVTRPSNTTFSAILWYPATSAGQNAPLAEPGVRRAAITFGHGFLQTVDRYQSTLSHLATRGYLAIASESEGGLFPSHQSFANDLRHCLSWLEEQDVTASSFLFGSVDTGRFGASGHSMGGGASILAAAADSRIRALANLAAANTNPSAIAAMANVTQPTMLLAGSSDTIVPVGSNGQLMYAAGRAPKQLPVLQGGWHCGFQDASVFGCDSGPMPRATQLYLTRRSLTAFFDLYLRGIQSVWSLIWGLPMRNDSQIVTTFDSGIGIDPPNQAKTAANGTATYSFTVTNRLGVSSAFRIGVSGNQWRTLLPVITSVLAPGTSETVRVVVHAPMNTQPGTSDTAVISVWAMSDRATREITVLTTTSP
jgi:dienelactone hydrolase